MAAGIKPGDTVITTPYTFFATAGSIARTGAGIIFADIDPDTYNISAESVEQAISALDDSEINSLKAIIPVHLYGQCAEMDKIKQISKKYNLVVIEDAAQAIGAEYKGTRAGSIGDMGCFSFFPSKNLGAFGDAGMVTTNSEKFDYKLRILRGHGSDPKYYHKLVGGNFRIDAIQAAVISIKLKYLDIWTAARQKNWADVFDITWYFGFPGNHSLLNHQHNADYLDNGNIIVADSENQRIIFCRSHQPFFSSIKLLQSCR